MKMPAQEGAAVASSTAIASTRSQTVGRRGHPRSQSSVAKWAMTTTTARASNMQAHIGYLVT